MFRFMVYEYTVYGLMVYYTPFPKYSDFALPCTRGCSSAFLMGPFPQQRAGVSTVTDEAGWKKIGQLEQV